MSVEVMACVWRSSRQKGGKLLVLLAMADFANDEGLCWPSVATLAKKARLSDRQAQRALRELESDGEVALVKAGGRENGRARASVYRVVGQNVTQPDGRHFVQVMGDISGSSRVTPMSPQPSVEPSVEPPSSLNARARTKLGKVDGKPTTPGECSLASAILREFNDRAGTNFTAKDWLRSIVMRVREHPELDEAHHKRVIDKVFEEPWWQGQATPSVLYGNGRVFETALVSIRRKRGADESGMTFGERVNATRMT